MTTGVIADILDERARQLKKWGVQNHTDGDWALILLEELGEVAKDILERRPEKADKELVEVAAVAVAWIENRRANRVPRRLNDPLPVDPGDPNSFAEPL